MMTALDSTTLMPMELVSSTMRLQACIWQVMLDIPQILMLLQPVKCHYTPRAWQRLSRLAQPSFACLPILASCRILPCATLPKKSVSLKPVLTHHLPPPICMLHAMAAEEHASMWSHAGHAWGCTIPTYSERVLGW